VIAHTAESIVNFRGPLVREMVARGLEVFALAPDYDEATKAAVTALGARPIDYSLSRATVNPWRDLRDFLRLRQQLHKLEADITFAYTIKPVIYGTLAARFAGVPSRYVMIEGAGHLFVDDGTISLCRGMVRAVTMVLYALSLSQAKRIFMLNKDDIALFTRWGMASRSKVVLIDGIGLDLEYYRFAPPVFNPICFILVARLLKEKGVYDYIEAARKVRAVCPEARFILLGSIDRNPTSVTYQEVERLKAEGLVEVAGHVSDVRPWLEKASVFVLPSYREGLPRSSQEAMALGRPVIATDVPGCRDTVIEGENGFVVPVRDSAALATAMLKFVYAPKLVAEMGARSRSIAEKRFDVHRINAQILQEIGIMPVNAKS
jgi:glycosyltransferase involved in cell wall biosynthesis